jgi:hypothetical protein
MAYNAVREAKQSFLFEQFFPERLIINQSAVVDGNLSLNFGDTDGSLENRKKFLKKQGIDYTVLVCAKQVHGCVAAYACEKDKGSGALSYESAIPSTDALITNIKDIPLAILTADCLPVFLYDPLKNAIGLVHAGWRSTKEKIVANTLEMMRKHFSSDPRDIFAGFGFCIRTCCYEVGKEFIGIFDKGLSLREGKMYLDLIEVNKSQLTAFGVQGKNIFDSNICTFCKSSEYFSYRKESHSCSRMMSVMMLSGVEEE